jgi:quercetin dioxygenase-like cupin family protein
LPKLPRTNRLCILNMHILADTAATEGYHDLIEGTFPSKAATPLHLHTTYAEQFHVLEGEFTLHVVDKGVVLKPGDSFHIPKGIKHAFVSGTAGARGIAVASPTSFT